MPTKLPHISGDESKIGRGGSRPGAGRKPNEQKGKPTQDRLVVYLPKEHHEAVRQFAEQFKKQ